MSAVKKGRKGEGEFGCERGEKKEKSGGRIASVEFCACPKVNGFIQGKRKEDDCMAERKKKGSL